MLQLLLAPMVFDLPQASTMAPKTDALYDFIWWVSLASLIPTMIALIYFAIKYRASKAGDRVVPWIHGHALFEWSVSVVLSIVFVVIFVWGLIGFNEIYAMPENAYEINVIGQQWLWTFQYANGKTTNNELYVPKGVPVRLLMTSKDVIHDFYVPNFRLKQDVVPGQFTSLWFQATQAGEHQIFCAQYCGTAHSNMIGKVVVLEPEQFKVWLGGGDPNKVNMAELGSHLFQKRNCVACHNLTGASKIGPSLAGLYNSMVTLADGSQVKADENYLRTSLVNPAGQVVQGFGAIMPTYKGLLSEEDINALVAYIKSLKE